MQTHSTLAIMQPYFLPYLGYFQLMAKADVFVIYDDVNFINRGWVNRNRININGKAHMLTVPLQHASQNKLICDISISNDTAWRGKFLKIIQQAYAKSPQFSQVYPLLESIVNHLALNLADYLRHGLIVLRNQLGLKTQIIESSRCYGNQALKGQARIIDICHREKALQYINPVGGLNIYNREDFEKSGLKLAFMCPTLPSYGTGKSPFVPSLSIVDVLMHNPPEVVSAYLDAGVLL